MSLLGARAHVCTLHTLAALAVADCLALGRESEAEATLSAMLEHPNPTVKAHVISLLSQVGTIASVPLLLEHKADEAVAAIQERAGGSPGAVSLSSANLQQGGLSLTAQDAGQLSILPGDEVD